MSRLDQQMMARAIQLAKRGCQSVSPNPAVGSVIVNSGKIVGEGCHVKAGEAHAEAMALALAGDKAKDATVYVTLEPCSHFGRTPPCAEALIKAGVKRVVYGMEDPNPQVSGQGLKLLREAGIAVVGPIMPEQAQALNRGFIKRHQLGLPFVRVKMASSVDGRTAMANGESQWITGAAARRDVQELRAASCAIVSGINTLLIDDARLTVRGEEFSVNPRQPLRVIVDSNDRLPKDAALLAAGGKVLQVLSKPEDFVLAQTEQLEQVNLPGKQGVDLTALLHELAARQCNEVLIEAGATLAGSFVAAGLVDELVVYMAPTLLGSNAKPLLNLPLDKMSQQHRLKLQDIRAVGDDLRMTYSFELTGDQ